MTYERKDSKQPNTPEVEAVHVMSKPGWTIEESVTRFIHSVFPVAKIGFGIVFPQS